MKLSIGVELGFSYIGQHHLTSVLIKDQSQLAVKSHEMYIASVKVINLE